MVKDPALEFDRIWRSSPFPDIDAFLAAHPDNDIDLLVDVVLVDMEWRWRMSPFESSKAKVTTCGRDGSNLKSSLSLF